MLVRKEFGFDEKKKYNELKIIKNAFKNNYCEYPHPNQKYWCLCTSRFGKKEVIDLNKNIIMFRRRVKNYGILLRHVACNFCIHFFVLTSEKNRLVIYNYLVDFQKIIADIGECIVRIKTAVISDHAIMRALERHYSSINEALIECSHTLINETLRVFFLEGKKRQTITAYSESEIYMSDNSGVLAVAYEPKKNGKDIFGVIIAKTFINSKMLQEFNKTECESEYYHKETIKISPKAEKALEDFISSVSIKPNLKSIPKKLIPDANLIDVTVSKEVLNREIKGLIENCHTKSEIMQ